MKDFCRFLFFRYWNDTDARATDYRQQVLIAWAVILMLLAPGLAMMTILALRSVGQ